MEPEPNHTRSALPGEGFEAAAAIFSTAEEARRAVRELQDEGFAPEDIGVMMRDHDIARRMKQDPALHVAEGAALGAVEGGLLGGVLGLVVGALVVPGVGPIVAGGALASAIATAGSTALAGVGLGAATGTLVGVLTEHGLSESEQQRLHEGMASGGVAVTVRARDRIADAIAILARHHGDTGGRTGNLNPLYHDQPAWRKPETEEGSTRGSAA